MISNAYWISLRQSAPLTYEEFDWFAIDTHGFMAVFSTAGQGPVPNVLWDFREEYSILKNSVECLKPVLDIQKVFSGLGSYEDWYEYARRGLFSFDYQDVHCTTTALTYSYQLMARPIAPTTVVHIFPLVNLEWVPRLQVSFRDMTRLPISIIK